MHHGRIIHYRDVIETKDRRLLGQNQCQIGPSTTTRYLPLFVCSSGRDVKIGYVLPVGSRSAALKQEDQGRVNFVIYTDAKKVNESEDPD